MATRLPIHRKGDHASASEVNQLQAAIRSSRLIGETPIYISDDNIVSIERPNGFYAQLTDGANPYGWQEVYRAGGAWSILPSGRFGSTTDAPAYEANDISTLPPGTIAQLTPGWQGSDYRFQQVRLGAPGPPVILTGCCPGIPIPQTLTVTPSAGTPFAIDYYVDTPSLLGLVYSWVGCGIVTGLTGCNPTNVDGSTTGSPVPGPVSVVFKLTCSPTGAPPNPYRWSQSLSFAACQQPAIVDPFGPARFDGAKAGATCPTVARMQANLATCWDELPPPAVPTIQIRWPATGSSSSSPGPGWTSPPTPICSPFLAIYDLTGLAIIDIGFNIVAGNPVIIRADLFNGVTLTVTP